MSLRSFFGPLPSGKRKRRADYGHTTRPLRFETFEDRRLLSFTPAVTYATSFNPRAIATADFNVDGKLDLAATFGYDANTKVSVRLGDGAGGFGAAKEFAAPVSGDASYFFAADVNNDNKPDMIVSDGINGYDTLIGNGDGTFQAAVDTYGVGLVYAGHVSPGNAVIGLTTWLGADWQTYVQINWANSQGGFTPAGQAGEYWGYGYRFAPVNLNNDASLDVVTGDGVVFMGENWGLRFDTGYGGFIQPGVVTTGDFTGDGNADVVIASDSIRVFRGRGDGTLDAPILQPSNGTAMSSIATADFNADGKLDVVVTDRGTATATVMLGNGDGTLYFGGTFAVGTSPLSVAVGDFNGDGRPDVATANRDSANLSVLLNDGDWTVLPPQPPPPPALSVNDVTVTEGNTGTRNATFTVTLSKPAATDVFVGYGTASGTAMPMEDYNGGGNLIIPAGQTSATFSVAVVGDRIPELNETFTVYLHSVISAMIVDGQGICTIVNDDILPVISINDVSTTEGNSKSPKRFTFTVSLSSASDQPITVNYATANGTATAGSDYQSKTGSVTFAPGERTKTITVAVIGDKLKEPNETFFVNLSGAVGSEITDSQGLGTMLNDDRGSCGPRGNRNSFALAVDAAIDDWMFSGRKPTGRPTASSRSSAARSAP